MPITSEPASTHTITGYDPGVIRVDGLPYTHSLLIGSDGTLQPWNTDNAQSLTAHDFAALAALAAESFNLVLLGTGDTQVFPQPAWLQPFIERGIALEVMNTPAACRTYTMLAPDRNVLAALWL